MGRYISTKLFENYSVALRQWRASHSHCELLHGYALKFKVWFASNEPLEENQLDDMNWIVDYGGFKDAPKGNGLKSWMNYMWDHTLLIEKDDPYLDFFESAAMEDSLNRFVPDGHSATLGRADRNGDGGFRRTAAEKSRLIFSACFLVTCLARRTARLSPMAWIMASTRSGASPAASAKGRMSSALRPVGKRPVTL